MGAEKSYISRNPEGGIRITPKHKQESPAAEVRDSFSPENLADIEMRLDDLEEFVSSVRSAAVHKERVAADRRVADEENAEFWEKVVAGLHPLKKILDIQRWAKEITLKSPNHARQVLNILRELKTFLREIREDNPYERSAEEAQKNLENANELTVANIVRILRYSIGLPYGRKATGMMVHHLDDAELQKKKYGSPEIDEFVQQFGWGFPVGALPIFSTAARRIESDLPDGKTKEVFLKSLEETLKSDTTLSGIWADENEEKLDKIFQDMKFIEEKLNH